MRDAELDFREIYDAFQPRILRHLTRLVGESEAEDLTQETFIRARAALAGFRGESSLSTWLYRIATNIALDRLRSPSCRRIATEGLPADAVQSGEAETRGCDPWTGEKASSVEQHFLRKEMHECLRSYIERLPEDYRTVLVLSDLHGLSNKEIADNLGVTLDTVKIRLHRGRTRLLQDLEAHCDRRWIEELPFRVMSSLLQYIDDDAAGEPEAGPPRDI